MSDAAVRCMADFTNLVALAEASVRRYPNRPLFGTQRDGSWHWIAYGEWHHQVAVLRTSLSSLGVTKDDRVAIVSRNSPAWATAAYATYGLGAVFVPLYETQRAEDWELVLRDCGASVVFARTPQLSAMLRAMQHRLPALRHVITLETARMTGPQLVQPATSTELVAAHHPAPDDLAELIYTSGTTGVPKGVMLTHGNLTASVAATLAAFPVAPEDRTVSFLPWAHVYGQLCELHVLLAAGASSALNTEPDRLLDDLHSAKPTLLVATPRVFDQILAMVRAYVATRSRAVQQRFWRGVAVSARRHNGDTSGPRDRLSSWLTSAIGARMRRRLGGHLRAAISGSFALTPDVAELIEALGIALYEGYGLTETAGIVTVNRPGGHRLGSVGRPLPGVRIELDRSRANHLGEGEIIVHGPSVMKGYHARPDDNAAAFTADGGFRTGDLGRIDNDGFVFITGRIEEEYQLDSGKYVSPHGLEERLSRSPFIRRVMLYGADRPYNVALVAIDPPRVRAWAAAHHVEVSGALTEDEHVRALIQDELTRQARDFRAYERPVDCVLTETRFTVESGLVTPTLELRRRDVLAQFGSQLAALYDKPRIREAPRPEVTAPDSTNVPRPSTRSYS